MKADNGDSPGESTQPEAGVFGVHDLAFEPVAEAFRENFASRQELGAAVCVFVDGRRVVDLWGGWAYREERRPWQRDTLVNVYSVGKAVISTLALSAVARGWIDLDEPLAKHWPEIAVKGKSRLTLRMVLAHRAGLPAVRPLLPDEAMYDWAMMCSELASQEPWWEPGSAHGYHVNTFGFLIGEALQRAVGGRVPEMLREMWTGPLDIDFFFGLNSGQMSRVAKMYAPEVILRTEEEWALAFPPSGDSEHDRMVWHTYFNPPRLCGAGSVNTEAWRRSVFPSTSGHADARAVAAMFNSLLRCGDERPPGLPADLLSQACRAHSDGEDRILGKPTVFGLGYQLSRPERPLGGSAGFGHYGFGGQLGFADPESGVAFGYLTNLPGPRWQTDRTQALVDAVYRSLGVDSVSF